VQLYCDQHCYHKHLHNALQIFYQIPAQLAAVHHKQQMISQYLILAELAVLVLLLTLFLECDNDKTDKNVDHEERNDNDVDKVEYGDLHPMVVFRAKTLAIRVNARVHQAETGKAHRNINMLTRKSILMDKCRKAF